MKGNIVNIINFMRNNGNSAARKKLFQTSKKQIEALKKYRLPSTSLLQYDVLIDENFTGFLKKNLDGNDEIGVWLEIVQQLAEKAGILWRGRKGDTWDHHSNVGFCIGYAPEEREILVDACMAKFKEAFGSYPKSVGSWHIDAHTLKYLEEKYSVVASCNCKDQWGTDGYTLWGGYYNQAYYPSAKNAFCPAQTKKNQINIPVFRMLGNDPIYQYDEDIVFRGALGNYSHEYLGDVMTMEPTSPCGRDPLWVEWYINNFKENCLTFGYSQTGQENSMGWEGIGDGYIKQLCAIDKKFRNGEVKVETLCKTGKRFKKDYKTTPASSTVAMSDWRKLNHRSIWYYSRFYRVNILEKMKGWTRKRADSKCISDGGWAKESVFWLRDIHIFNEEYAERYLQDTCATKGCVYDNLPVCNGFNWSSGNIRAGIYPVVISKDSGLESLPLNPDLRVNKIRDNGLSLTWGLNDENKDMFQIRCLLDRLEFKCVSHINWGLKLRTRKKMKLPFFAEKINDPRRLSFIHNGFKYQIDFLSGFFEKTNAGNLLFLPENGLLSIKFN